MIDFFSTGPEGQWIWMTLGEGEHVKSEAENPPQRTSRQQVLNLTPKSTELQLSCPCDVVMPGERQGLAGGVPKHHHQD